MKRWSIGLLGVLVVASWACSLVTDLSPLDSSDAQVVDVVPPTTCDAAALACVTEAPTGWIGPLEYYEGDAGFPTCPGTQLEQVKGYQGFVAPPAATCTPCACAVSNPTCNAQITGYMNSTTCGTTACGTGSLTLGTQCMQAQGIACAGEQSIVVTGVVAKGSCAVTGGTLDAAPPSWTGEALGCMQPAQALVRADCAQGQVCAPAPVKPFGGAMCVTHDGDMACPAGYPNKHTFSTGANDTRACSSCKCAVASAPCTNIAIKAATDPQCDDAAAFSVGACISMPSQSQFVGVNATPPALSCSVDGGVPSGTVTAGATQTVCCQ